MRITPNGNPGVPPDPEKLAQATRQVASRLVADEVPWWQWTFHLARRLMKFPGLTDAHRRQVAHIFHQQLIHVDTERRGLMGLEAITADLLRFAIKPPDYAEGEAPLEAAHRRMQEDPCHFKSSTGPLYDKLGSLAYYLDMSEIDRNAPPILLPQKRLAQLLGVPQPTISRILQLLVAHRVLQIVDAAWWYTHKKAKEYRFIAADDSFGMDPASYG